MINVQSSQDRADVTPSVRTSKKPSGCFLDQLEWTREADTREEGATIIQPGEHRCLDNFFQIWGVKQGFYLEDFCRIWTHFFLMCGWNMKSEPKCTPRFLFQ